MGRESGEPGLSEVGDLGIVGAFGKWGIGIDSLSDFAGGISTAWGRGLLAPSPTG